MLDLHWAPPRGGCGTPASCAEAGEKPATGRLDAPEYIPDPLARAKQYRKSPGGPGPRPRLRPPARLVAKVGGYNGRFMTLMLPRAKGSVDAPTPGVERLPSLPNSLAVQIRFPKLGVVDTVIWAYEHQTLARGGDVSGRGNWVVVRRAAKTGGVIDCTGGALKALSVDGRNQSALKGVTQIGLTLTPTGESVPR